ncbi:CHAT domain-containing protein [Glycomyces sp. NPDC046736]|uniref:CHAT domain-containing protein n=1 Tax=Glycomyces sp. NPDC046736 TaxID=3155615 RepID=UPI00340D0917
MKDFEELRIRLRRSGTGRYLAVANGAARGAAVLHIGDEPRRLRAEYRHLVDIDLHRAGSGGKDVAAEMRELGRKTFDLVFGGPLGEVLQAARAAQGSGGLRLRFDLPPELADLPVETLCGPSGRPDQTFAFDANLSLVRTLPAQLPQSRMPAAEDPTEPISILVAVARPEGLPEIGGDLEAARIENDLPHLTASATVLKSATRAKIGSWLERQSGPAAVVLVAHGDYDERGGIGAVILEDEDGGPDLVSGDLLGGMLVEAPKLRLVVLDLCHSSRGGAAESFGGLAQAIIGRGVPAVVGMNGLVTDDVAATIGPTLLLDVCRNKTVDEAVLGARRRVAHNGRTAIEWGTPTLYVHEGVGHGWLFKVRGVKGGNAVDFLRHGRKAVEALVGGDGDFSPQQIIDAARFYRGERSWQLVKRTGEVNFENAELARLKEEAQLELDWAGIEKLCAGMAEDGKAASITATMRALARRLPEDVGAVLKAEAKEYGALDGLMSKAAKAERDEDWEDADDLYGQVLRLRPDGFRDAAARLAASREERTLAAAYAEAVAFEDAGEWPETERTFAAILAQRADGYRDSAARAAYATGRRREAEEDWGGAAEAYTACGGEADDERSGRGAADSTGRGGYRDSRHRADYCEGRKAVAESQWDLAAERLAGLAIEDAEQWRRYAQGRIAEAAGQWATAAERFGDLGSFADSADRRLLAEGHLALAARDHQAAADRFSRVRHLDPPVDEVLASLYAAAEAAESAEDWVRAAEAYGAAAGFEDAAARRDYCAARAAEAELLWAEAAASYRATDHRDAAARLPYAEGRAAEQAGDWDGARERYRSLPNPFGDSAGRADYAQGRAADARRDWEAVVAGFAGLPDRFDDGEVGRRRRYARAARAADGEEWTEVLAHLRHADDAEHDGDVGRLRLRARGAQAEQTGDWAGAVAAYTEGGDEFAEALHYALLRRCEVDADWDGMLEAARHLPPDHRDVGTRGCHAEARQALARGDWDGALGLLGALPADFDGREHLILHARFGKADAEADWPTVAALADQIEAEGHIAICGGDVHIAITGSGEDARGRQYLSIRGRYARGRMAELDADWDAAAEAFRACDGHTDAPARVAYADGRRLEAQGRLREAIALYDRADTLAAAYADGRESQRRESETTGLHGRAPAPAPAADGRRTSQGSASEATTRRDPADGRIAPQGRPRDANPLDDHADALTRRSESYGRASEATILHGHADGRRESSGRSEAAALRDRADAPAMDHADSRSKFERRASEATALHGHADGRRKSSGRSEAAALRGRADALAPDDADGGRESHGRDTEPAIIHDRADALAPDDADGRRASQGREGEATTPSDPADGRIAPQDRPREATALRDQADGRRESSGRNGAAARRDRADALTTDHADDRRASEGRESDTTALPNQADGRRESSGRSGAAARRDRADSLTTGHADDRRASEGRSREANAVDDHADTLARAAARSRRLNALLDALPWAETLATDSLVADPVAAADPGFPYTAFAAAGITPSSSAADVQNATFELMMVGGISEQALKSWDRLRLPDRRLLLDAQLYGFPDRPAFAAVLADLDPEADPLAAICERLPDSAPLFRLLAGDRAAAVEAWKARLTEAPGNMPDAHRLAVAALWHAIELEAGGAWEHAERLWRLSLACWAALLGDDEYWTVWSLGRAAHYGHAVLPGETSRLRADLGQHLMSILAAIAERHAREGRPGPAARSRALVSVLEAEMEAAQCLRDAGGLPLPGEGRIACGPGYLALTGLRPNLARFVAAAEADADLGDAALRRLRWSFSGFGRAFADYERHRYSAALRRLPDPRALRERPEDCDGPAPGHDPDCPQCAAFLAYDPAYAHLPRRGHRLLRDAVELAVRARLSAAHHLLGVDGRTDDAIAELSQAIATAAHAAMAVRTRQDVQRLVLGRVRSLTEAGGRSTRRLDAAVALLDAATPLVGRSGAADLNRAASKLRVDRALIRYNADRSADVAPLLPDIRDALDLHPDSVRGLDTLSRFVQLVNAAAPEYEQRERAARLVDVLERLHTAFAHAEASAALAATQDEILDSVKDLVFHWMSPREIADLLESYNDDPGDPRDLAERARGRSPERLDTIIRAVDDLVRALRLSPFDPDIRASLTEALTRLIDFLDRREGP